MISEPAFFRLTSTRVGDRRILSVAGEIDISTVSALRRGLRSAVDAASEDFSAVVVDLSAVSFIDSSGLTAIATAETSARVRGCSLLLTGVSPGTLRLLRILGLGSRWDLAAVEPSQVPEAPRA